MFKTLPKFEFDPLLKEHILNKDAEAILKSLSALFKVAYDEK
jgi:hypothetical protein